MLTTVFVVIFVFVGAVLIFAATKPDAFRVERTTTIQAPPERIFGLINDFDKWPAWSPWERMDPTMKRMRSGAPTGTGSIYEWEGNSKVGKGRMEIVESSPHSKIQIKLDFMSPFEAHNTAEFTVQPAGGQTRVTWAMYGGANYVTKVMTVFVSMDRMVGRDFATGLANMKAVAEAQQP